MGTSKKPPALGRNKVANAVLASAFAYDPDPLGLNSDVTDINTPLSKTEISGGTLILANMSEETSAGELSASVFIDREKKQITYAIAGTRLDQGGSKRAADLGDDGRLIIGIAPKKMGSIKKLNQTILDALEAEAQESYIGELMAQRINGPLDSLTKAERSVLRASIVAEIPKDRLDDISLKALEGYEISCTGHSLGAVLSDCAASDMHLRMSKRGMDTGKTNISSITFDNPGALTQVKNLCKGSGTNENGLRQKIEFKAFNNRPNMINSLDEQMGETFVILPNAQAKLNGFFRMCGYIAHKCKKIPVIGRMFRFLSRGTISTQMHDHLLSNFDEVLVQGRGLVRPSHDKKKRMTVDEAITGKEPLVFDKKFFEKLKSTDLEDKEKKIFSMTDPVSKERVEFSNAHLIALSEEKKQELPQTKSFSGSIDSARKSKPLKKYSDSIDIPKPVKAEFAKSRFRRGSSSCRTIEDVMNISRRATLVTSRS